MIAIKLSPSVLPNFLGLSLIPCLTAMMGIQYTDHIMSDRPSSLQKHYHDMKISVYLYNCPFSSWPSCLFIASFFVVSCYAYAAILFHW